MIESLIKDLTGSINKLNHNIEILLETLPAATKISLNESLDEETVNEDIEVEITPPDMKAVVAVKMNTLLEYWKEKDRMGDDAVRKRGLEWMYDLIKVKSLNNATEEQYPILLDGIHEIIGDYKQKEDQIMIDKLSTS